MAIPGKLGEPNPNTLRKRCACGMLVRRINTAEKIAFLVPRATRGHDYPIRSHVFKTKSAPDGLCDRCKYYGAKETKIGGRY